MFLHVFYDVLSCAWPLWQWIPLAQVMDFEVEFQGKILEHLVHVGCELLELPEGFLAKRLLEFCGTKNCGNALAVAFCGGFVSVGTPQVQST